MLAELHYAAPRALNRAEVQLQSHDLPELASTVQVLQGSVEVRLALSRVQIFRAQTVVPLVFQCAALS